MASPLRGTRAVRWRNPVVQQAYHAARPCCPLQPMLAAAAALWRNEGPCYQAMLSMPSSIPLSVLDLAPVTAGSTPADALRNTRELAQLADRCGYTRYWLAEHHNMTGIASAATAVVIAHIAGATRRIRVGAGGIMLPNHAPLVIAEQFGTLEALVSRTDRPRPRACAGHRPDDRARAATQPRRQRRPLPAGRARAAVLLSARQPRPGGARGAGRGAAGAALATRAPASTGPSWPPTSVCPSPSLRTSRRASFSRRSTSIAAASAPPPSSTGPGSRSPPTRSPPTPTRRRSTCCARCGCASQRWRAACAGSCSRRRPSSRRTGRRPSSPSPTSRWPARRSARRTPCAGSWRR